MTRTHFDRTWVRTLCVGGWLLWAAVACAAPTGGLIFYQDFDHQGRAVCGQGWALDQTLDPANLTPGRFGQAYRFERPRANLLSPNQASVEGGPVGFTAPAGVSLSNPTVPTAFGKRVLRASGARVLWQTAPLATTVVNRYRPAKVFLFSAYLRADKPGTKVRLTLADQTEAGNWRAVIEAANQAALTKDPKATVKPPLATVSVPGEATLGPSWQRVAARLELDTRRPQQTLVGALEVLSEGGATIDADGLQLEQTCVYPLSNTDPTTWLPGGEKREAAWLDLALAQTGFTGRQGTIGCWVRPLPEQCGGSRTVGSIIALGNGWFSPLWQVGGYPWYAGAAPTKQPKGKLHLPPVEQALLEAGANNGWHQLTLAWDEQECAGYMDGRLLGKAPLTPGEPAPGAVLRLGGTFLEQATLTGDLDEVFVSTQRLDETAVKQLAAASAPLSQALPTILLQRPQRTIFLRSEAEAALDLAVVPYGSAPAQAKIVARCPELQATLSQTVSPGKPARMKLKPWLSAPGECHFEAEVTAGKSTLQVTDTLSIFEEPTTPEFIIYAWGGSDPDLPARGFNCLFGEPRSLLQRGMWAIGRIDVRNAVPHPWSPESRLRARPIAEGIARAALGFPNLRAMLVNSEVGHPPFPPDKWFADWMKQETGLAGIPPQIVRDPVHCAPGGDFSAPPVLPESNPQYKFLRWWEARGQGYWLLGNQLVRWMREAGLKTIYYTDQPEVPEQFADMDMIDYWGYPKAPEGLVARFSQASAMARLTGKTFQAMPGTVYWDDGNGLWLKDDDGKRKVLCLSPDCLKENLWLSVACPTVSIGLYGLGERHTEIYDKACDEAMTEAYSQISPVGVLVGGLPAEAARVAMLETDGLYFIQPGVGDDWVRHWLTRTAGRTLARARLPFDWIGDAHVQAGWLKRYDAVFVPGAWSLPEKTYRALVAYAQAGGQVVTDGARRVEIPSAMRLNLPTQAYTTDAAARELGGWAESFRRMHPGWAKVSPAENVITYTREAGPARYLFVVNDHREPGPQYDKWQVRLNGIGPQPSEPLRDRGLPQTVQVTIPTGFAVYDVLAHRALPTERQGDRQMLTLDLPAGGAAVLAAFPRALTRLTLTLPARLQAGSEGLLSLKVLDETGRPAPGRQMVQLTVTQPDGVSWTGVQRYRRVTEGVREVPLRLPLSAAKGVWRVEALEWTSGLQAKGTITVE